MASTAKDIQPSWRSQLLPLAGIVVLGSLIASYVASLTPANTYFGASQLNSNQFIAWTVLTALTVIYLAYLRARLFFSTRWLIAAVIYNGLILFVKFNLSANQYRNQAIDHSLSAIFSTAFLVSLLYGLVFGMLYLFFDGRLLNRKLHKALIVTREGKLLLATGFFMAATLLRIVAFRLPGLAGSNASSYLNTVFKSDALLISALLFGMIFAAMEAYAQVRRRSDLKYQFVNGLVLILAFHLWWALFIYRGL